MDNKFFRKKIFEILLILETMALIYFSILPASSIPGSAVFSLDSYIQHFIAYMVYGILLAIVFAKPKNLGGVNNSIIIALVLGSLFGLLNELIQGFVPTRNTDIMDFFFDAIGAGLGGLMVRIKPTKVAL